MPRIRTIKPEFWGSPDTASAHPVTRLTYIALWNWADDYGRGTANFKELEGFVFPNDEVDELSDGKFRKFRDIVAEVQRAYKVTFYECDGRMFYEIPSWNEHQRTERKAKARIPDPSAGVIVDLTTGNTVTPGTSDAQRRNFRDTTEEAPQSPPTGKGTGEREKEVKDTTTATRSAYSEEFESWWSLYYRETKPAAGSKKKASVEYKKATRQMSHDELMAALSYYFTSKRKERASGTFSSQPPHAERWLRDERWTDYGTPATTARTTGSQIPDWSKTECDQILGGEDHWVPGSPPPGLNLMEEREWKQARAAEHLDERRRKAWEVVNSDNG